MTFLLALLFSSRLVARVTMTHALLTFRCSSSLECVQPRFKGRAFALFTQTSLNLLRLMSFGCGV